MNSNNIYAHPIMTHTLEAMRTLHRVTGLIPVIDGHRVRLIEPSQALHHIKLKPRLQTGGTITAISPWWPK